jgi:cytochrome c
VFGESNDWIPIAGGVKPGDIDTGRASALLTPDAMRTVGTKLNSAPSLWDYIHRSMPLTAPKTLSADETYAITAYVLHLNEILPADARVDEKSLARVRMPNRFGFTEEHGFKTRLGRPDVRNTACMAECATDVRVRSEIPEHARNAHGNLREQMRWYGAIRGVDTTVPAGKSPELWRSGAFDVGRPAGGARAASTAAVSAAGLVQTHGCTACHGVATRIVGPGFAEIAARYQGDAGADAMLVEKMKQGGSGVWGQVPMPAQPELGDGDAHSIVRWILSGAKS